MTTTTERPGPSLSRHATGVSNLKLYLIALLATAYVLAWWLFGARAADSSAAAPAIEASSEPSGQPRSAWFHDLPTAERPVVEVPAGWHIADRTAPSPGVIRSGVPVPVRVSPARAGRIRTRSS